MQKTGGGPQMDIETLGFLGFVFATATLAAIAYERRMDVLYGPYIQSRAGARAGFSLERLWKPLHSAADRLRWRARNVIYLTSIVAC
jgi:hypothetical protein